MAVVEYVIGPGRQPQSRVAIESSNADGVVYALNEARSSEAMASLNPVQVVARTSWATDWVTRFPGGPVCVPGAGLDDGDGVDGVTTVDGVVPDDAIGRVLDGVAEDPAGGVVGVACEGTRRTAGTVVVVEPLTTVGEPFSAYPIPTAEPVPIARRAIAPNTRTVSPGGRKRLAGARSVRYMSGTG
jgi:hypothetical protein